MTKRPIDSTEVVKKICIEVNYGLKRTIIDMRDAKRHKKHDDNTYEEGYQKGYEDCMRTLDKKLTTMLQENFETYVRETNNELNKYFSGHIFPTFVF